MDRFVLRGRVRHRAALAAFSTSFVLVNTALAAPTRVYVFGAKPNATFEVRKNSGFVATVTATPFGTVSADADAVSGDRVEVTAPDLAPPVPPLFASLATNDAGCATAAWLPSGDPSVMGYVVSFGTQSVAGGGAPAYEQSVDAGTSTLHTECSLTPGTYYFAVRARNAGGLSAYSIERSVVIQTLAVLFSMFEATAGEDGVRLSWRVEADEVVQGYRVYRSEGAAPEVRIADLNAGAESYVDASARAGSSFTYIVAAVNEAGDEVRSVPASVTTPTLALSLGQNYPNPFNPTTKIPFTLESEGRVLIRVFDVRGARVATIFDGTLGQGRHSVEWSGKDDAGRPVASGLYLYTLTTGKRTMSKKMVMVK
ncbi:MAG TPA: FlgD immunoglobulin-like domain containing protein [Candidatus Krumholzibacteria bacterium]|nr:FlgD immunoglobulin-like domain containing protein [Candidatus Krumholzibacteria bacterium]